MDRGPRLGLAAAAAGVGAMALLIVIRSAHHGRGILPFMLILALTAVACGSLVSLLVRRSAASRRAAAPSGRDRAVALAPTAMQSEPTAAAPAMREPEPPASLTPILAHDLQVSLRSLAAAARDTAAEENEGRRQRSAGLVARTAADMASLLEDLADPAGSHSGQAGVRQAPTDLLELAEDVCALFWRQACAKGVDLAAYVDPATPRCVSVDPAQLRQVIATLVDRAVSRTERGGVLVEIEPDGATVRISVHDTGAADAAGAPDPCRRRVEALGGRFAVRSEPARGSSFAIRLPVEAIAPAQPWPEAPVAGFPVRMATAGPSTRRALGRYLSRAGYTVGTQPASMAGLAIEDAASCTALRIFTPGDATDGDSSAGVSLPQPFRRADLEAVLRRMQAGEPLQEFVAVGDGRVRQAVPPPPESGAATAPSAPDELIDHEVAAHLADMAAAGRSEFVARVHGLYRDNAPESVAKLADAISRTDAQACARAAQALRAMSSNVGARLVARMAGEIETAARAGSLPLPADVAKLRDLLQRTLEQIARPEDAAAARSDFAASEDAELIRDVETALAEDQMSLVYQPQMDRDGERIVGVETLIRWVHPQKGPISPAVFIPVLERYGLIGKVTSWVVDRLLAETRFLSGLQVAFNASAIEFAEPDFVDRLHAMIVQHGYDPRRLEVEITETAILQNETAVRENIDRLRALGMKVALDDFGAGYSSLGHLRRYPFDKLKIDREFVTDCSRDMQSATIVHAVVSIGRALGMQVIAEGVETDTQRKFLKVAGVHAMQGYLFGKAVSVDELARMLSRRNTAVKV